VGRELVRLKPARIVILGGTGAVSTAVADRLKVLGADLAQASGGRVTRTTQVAAGSCLASPSGGHRMCVEDNGLLGVYRGETPLWTSGVTDAAPLGLRVGGDGNAVIYGVDGRIIWQSSTSGTGATELAVQDDGDLMLRTVGGAIV